MHGWLRPTDFSPTLAMENDDGCEESRSKIATVCPKYPRLIVNG